MSTATSGTFTFLISDIEGSTHLARRLGDDWGNVLGDHHRLLRTAFEEAGGEGIGTQGDAFFVAFRRPKDAALAALAAQRSLATHDWPEGVAVRVRMGIHTGEGSVSAGEYHGVAIHRAARLCSACNGGEILLSQVTSALLEDEEHVSSAFMLVDLGEQQLKDFERPVRVFRLVAAETVESAPAADGEAGGVRVLIVDDQALVRAGFRMILDAYEDIEVIGEASNGEEAVTEAFRLRPDVVLMDVRMPALDGIEATRILLDGEGAHAKVVMLTTFDMDEYVYEALRAGASGFLLKDVPPEQLVAGIRAVASGEALLAPAVTRRVIEEFVRLPRDAPVTPSPKLAELTARELEVLKLMARGLSNAEIADELVVSQATVKTHVARVLTKLGLRDRVQAVVLAYESGLVVPGAPSTRPV
jgi:DNA-binding NarL/FixJ family response regulator/class 3 adenylate cyclase